MAARTRRVVVHLIPILIKVGGIVRILIGAMTIPLIVGLRMSESVLRCAALQARIRVIILIGSPLLGARSMRRRQVLVSFQILVSFIVFGGMPRAFVVLRLLISRARRRVVAL